MAGDLAIVTGRGIVNGNLMGTFYTDVIQKDARFQSAEHVADVALLEPITRRLVEQIIASAQKMGIALMVYETYRSQARQQDLFDNGASKLRTVGVHHYGLACDIVRSIGGEPSWKGDFSFLGELAHASGLIWGGDWGDPAIKHSFVDAVHVQRCTVARQAALFAGSWYPDDAYNPYTDDPDVLLAAATPARPVRSASSAVASRPGKKPGPVRLRARYLVPQVQARDFGMTQLTAHAMGRLLSASNPQSAR